MNKRVQLLISGQVQGVGFRPFVYTIASSLLLSGFVKNTKEGVLIELQGSEVSIEKFRQDLISGLPPLAYILSLESVDIECLPLKEGEKHNFAIIQSEESQTHQTLISPDFAHCDACKSEMLDQNDTRYLYPFINCTHCGPRFSITHSLPYDRKTTSMHCFELCPTCHEEYTNPLDRRFHAQPTACHICGVKVWALTNEDNEENKENFDAIKASIQKLHQGMILAIKGLGGFHLACDAFNVHAIQKLRQRKQRKHKALALMVQSIEKAKEIAYIDEEEEKLLQSQSRPIVVCKRKQILPNILSPDTDTIGMMLPVSPLHELFFNASHFGEKDFKALVMTSANAKGEPLCLSNREARAKLSHIADDFLFHNRDILVRVDDSVLFAYPQKLRENLKNAETEYSDTNALTSPRSKPSFISIRRSRGYVPSFLSLPLTQEKIDVHKENNHSILAFGADLKNTVCVTKYSKNSVQAFVGQHIGDCENLKNQEFQAESIAHLTKILAVKPDVIVCDEHPNAYTSLLANEYAKKHNTKIIKLQHHIAHAFALAADNNIDSPFISLVLDGTGYGLDSTFWGGELFSIDPQKGKAIRHGHFQKVHQVANDKAVYSPYYMGQVFLHALGIEDYFFKKAEDFEENAIKELCKKNIGIESSSCGRLLDAIGVLLDCTKEENFQITYEGQVPIILEKMQNLSYNHYDILKPISKVENEENMLLFPSLQLFANCYSMKQNNVPYADIARYAHLTLSHSLALWAYTISKKVGISKVGLSGGVFLNRTILTQTFLALQEYGLEVILHKEYSPSDASISLGQAYFAAQLLEL